MLALASFSRLTFLLAVYAKKLQSILVTWATPPTHAKLSVDSDISYYME